MVSKNPFTPAFGVVPAAMAGRGDVIERVLAALANGPGDPALACLLVGPRGCGKTALLLKIGQDASARGWLPLHLTALPGLLEVAYDETVRIGAEFLGTPNTGRLTGVNLGGFGLAWQPGQSFTPSTWRGRFTQLLDRLKEHQVGLLLTVDEVDPTLAELRELVADYQHFIGQGRQVALLLAGLPGRITDLLDDKTISFLRRATRYDLAHVSITEAAQAINRTVELSGRQIDQTALFTAAQATDGYPLMIQLIGYYAWVQQPTQPVITVEDVKQGQVLARLDMNQKVIEPTLRQLSNGDRHFLSAMAVDDGPTTVVDIAKRLKRSSNLIANYRRRLINRSVIGQRGRGMVDFEIPGLREYLRNVNS